MELGFRRSLFVCSVLEHKKRLKWRFFGTWIDRKTVLGYIGVPLRVLCEDLRRRSEGIRSCCGESYTRSKSQDC